MPVVTLAAVHAPSLNDVRAAWRRVGDLALRTPLLPFFGGQGKDDISLKLESLQPVGAYKARSAGNVIVSLPRHKLARGVFTASSGNMGIAVAWTAQRLGVPASVVVPDTAPAGKLARLEALGATVISVPYDDWWSVIETHEFPGLDGEFIDGTTSNPAMAGSGTIGVEILEDRPETETILVPIGGGGLACGIAAAAKAIKPDVRVLAVEVETSTPLTDAFAAGRPVPGEQRPCFVTGIGARTILAHMWPLLQRLIDGTVVVSLEQTADAIRALFRTNHLVAEGAGAAALAAALSGKAGAGPIVAVISGGNIDETHMIQILQGQVPN